MDIGEAFFSSKNEPFKFAAGNLLPYSLAEFRQIDTAIARVPALRRVISCRAASGTRAGLGLDLLHSPDAAQRVSGALLIRGPDARRALKSSVPPFAFSSGFLLGLQNLPALVHAGFQIEVMRTAQTKRRSACPGSAFYLTSWSEFGRKI